MVLQGELIETLNAFQLALDASEGAAKNNIQRKLNEYRRDTYNELGDLTERMLEA